MSQESQLIRHLQSGKSINPMQAHNFKDLTGKVFGRFTVVRYLRTDGKVSKWECVCECGSQKVVSGGNLRSGNSKSCGCLNREISSKMMAEKMRRHGMTDTPTWKSWKSMHDRCLLEKHKSYGYYRNIPICPEWLNNFEAFYHDMGERPKGTSLDRVDNTLGYSPGNCVWSTAKDQARNKSNNVFISHKGQNKTLAEWAENLGIRHCTIWRRLSRGLCVSDVLYPGSLKKGQPLKKLDSSKRQRKRFAQYSLSQAQERKL